MSGRHTGLKMIQLEDIGWRKQVAKEVARVKFLVFVYEDLADCTELSPELLVAGGAKEVCVLDSVGSCRWKYLEGSVLQEDEREVERYFCRGDLVIGTGFQVLGEVLSNWAKQDHDIHSPVSIDTINDHEGFAQHVLDVLRERVLDERVEVAFPAESRQEDVEGLGTLDMVRKGIRGPPSWTPKSWQLRPISWPPFRWQVSQKKRATEEGHGPRWFVLA